MDTTEVEIVAKKHLDSVYRVAINYSKNASDAGDAVQNGEYHRAMCTDRRQK